MGIPELLIILVIGIVLVAPISTGILLLTLGRRRRDSQISVPQTPGNSLASDDNLPQWLHDIRGTTSQVTEKKQRNQSTIILIVKGVGGGLLGSWVGSLAILSWVWGPTALPPLETIQAGIFSGMLAGILAGLLTKSASWSVSIAIVVGVAGAIVGVIYSVTMAKIDGILNNPLVPVIEGVVIGLLPGIVIGIGALTVNWIMAKVRDDSRSKV